MQRLIRSAMALAIIMLWLTDRALGEELNQGNELTGGNLWNCVDRKLSSDACHFLKIGIILGYHAGFRAGKLPYVDPFVKNATNGDWVKGLDEFYLDSTNTPIAIEGAVWIVSMELRGEKKDYIECIKEGLRHFAHGETDPLDSVELRASRCDKLKGNPDSK